jgi:hypothetical protein
VSALAFTVVSGIGSITVLVVSTASAAGFFSPQEETTVINPNDRARMLILNVVFIVLVGFKILKIYLNAERMYR